MPENTQKNLIDKCKDEMNSIMSDATALLEITTDPLAKAQLDYIINQAKETLDKSNGASLIIYTRLLHTLLINEVFLISRNAELLDPAQTTNLEAIVKNRKDAALPNDANFITLFKLQDAYNTIEGAMRIINEDEKEKYNAELTKLQAKIDTLKNNTIQPNNSIDDPIDSAEIITDTQQTLNSSYVTGRSPLVMDFRFRAYHNYFKALPPRSQADPMYRSSLVFFNKSLVEDNDLLALKINQSDKKLALAESLLDAQKSLSSGHGNEKALLKKEILSYIADIDQYKDRKIIARKTHAFEKGEDGQSRIDKLDKLREKLMDQFKAIDNLNANEIHEKRTEVTKLVKATIDTAGSSTLKRTIGKTHQKFNSLFCNNAPNISKQHKNTDNIMDKLLASVKAHIPSLTSKKLKNE
jgi:hypothetical protein